MADKEAMKAFYDRQLDFIARKDIEGLIDNQYTPDAELLNFDYYIKGEKALKDYFRSYIDGLGYIKLISTDKFSVGDDSMMFESTVEVAGGIARVYDVMLMRDGKIWRHFAGLLGFTPKS